MRMIKLSSNASFLAKGIGLSRQEEPAQAFALESYYSALALPSSLLKKQNLRPHPRPAK